MKHISAVFVVLVLSMTVPALSQTSESDSQTIQAILSELRSIHNDIRLTAISQILLTELQTQQTVVNAASERVNRARLELSNLHEAEKGTSANLEGLQDNLTNTSDAGQAENLSATVNNLKAALSELKGKEEELNTNLQTAEGQLRSAQDTVDDTVHNCRTTGIALRQRYTDGLPPKGKYGRRHVHDGRRSWLRRKVCYETFITFGSFGVLSDLVFGAPEAPKRECGQKMRTPAALPEYTSGQSAKRRRYWAAVFACGFGFQNLGSALIQSSST